jgi:hypothetical protein
LECEAVPLLNSPELQERAFIALLAKNKWELKRKLKIWNNNSEGIHVTESGILAAAHLGGAGSVKKVILKQGQALF